MIFCQMGQDRCLFIEAEKEIPDALAISFSPRLICLLMHVSEYRGLRTSSTGINEFTAVCNPKS